jgi:hypothetical protein
LQIVRHAYACTYVSLFKCNILCDQAYRIAYGVTPLNHLLIMHILHRLMLHAALRTLICRRIARLDGRWSYNS